MSLNREVSNRTRSDTYPVGHYVSIPSFVFEQQSSLTSGMHLRGWLPGTGTNTTTVLPCRNHELECLQLIIPGTTTHHQPRIAAAVHSQARLQSCAGGLQPSGKLGKEVELAVQKLVMHRLWFKVGRKQHVYIVYNDTMAWMNVIAESVAKFFKLDYKNNEPPYPLKPYGPTEFFAMGYAKGVKIAPGCWPKDVWYEADFHVVADHLLPEPKGKVYIGIAAIERCNHLKRLSSARCE